MDNINKEKFKSSSPSKLVPRNKVHGIMQREQAVTPISNRHVSRENQCSRVGSSAGKSGSVATSVSVISFRQISSLKGVLKKDIGSGTKSNQLRSVSATRDVRHREDGKETVCGAAAAVNSANGRSIDLQPKKSVRFSLDVRTEGISCKARKSRSFQRGNNKSSSRQKSRSKKPRSSSSSRSASATNHPKVSEERERASKRTNDTNSKTPVQEMSSNEIVAPGSLGSEGAASPGTELSCQSFPGCIREAETPQLCLVENGVLCDYQDKEEGTRTVRTQTSYLYHPKSTRASWAEGCSNNMASKATLTDITLPPSLQGTPLSIDGILYVPIHTALRTGLPLTMWERIMQKAIQKVLSDQRYKQYHRRLAILRGRRNL